MQARYICPDKSWILVNVLERVGELYKVHPIEWIGVERDIIYVPSHLLEFIKTDRM